MKKYLWIAGLILVVVAAFGYSLAAAKEKPSYWIASTITMVLGGVVLAASYFAYHN